uniref:Uncharacterized protein n=1 Tax=Rhizophora mucronata TaxID=61149 RepID=A0A2P2KFR5_RHIMU
MKKTNLECLSSS